MSAYRIDGYVIVSADGMLANADRVMPDELKFKGDQEFFNAALDRADLIVHGRQSYEGQPNSPKRRRIIVTSKTLALAHDPANPNAVLWNPTGATFEQACDYAGVRSGTVAIIGGPDVFGRFLDRYDTFWLSQAPRVRLPGGEPCFPGVPEHSPEQVLAARGLKAGEPRILDRADDVEDGRKELNFSVWGDYKPKRAAHKLEELCEKVEAAEMPLKKYTFLHPSAKLSDADRHRLCEWSSAWRREILGAK